MEHPHLAEQEDADSEPSCSLTSAPKATNKASMSDHRIDPLTGQANICSSVARCFRFMQW
jgi:hypothetical protein